MTGLPRSLSLPRNDKVLKFSFLVVSLLLLYCHCERQRSNPVKSCKFYLPPCGAGRNSRQFIVAGMTGVGGSVAGLNPPTQAFVIALQ